MKAIGLLPNFSNEEFRLARNLFFHLNQNYTRELAQFKIGLWQLFNRKPLTADLTDQELLKQTAADNPEILLTDSARSAFSLLMEALKTVLVTDKVKPADIEVILPAFTCVVIVNPVLWAGFKPVFVDISSETFNTEIEAIIAKVTPKTKAILIQHTFGSVLDVKTLQVKLKKLGRTDIVLIEDLAHVLGATSVLESDHETTNPLSVKSFEFQADFGVLTFGVEKVISTIRGGALVINQKEEKKSGLLTDLIIDLRTRYLKLPELPQKYQRRLLYNPIFWQLTLAVYYKGVKKLTLGRILTYFGHKLQLLGIAIDKIEYFGGKPKYLPAKFPAILAPLGVMQLRKLDKILAHRREMAKIYATAIQKTEFAEQAEQKFIQKVFAYNQVHGFLRYPLLLKSKAQRDRLFLLAKEQGYVLGDWYKTMFYTKPEFYSKLGYRKGSCPITEDIKDRIINLPTAPIFTTDDAQKISKLVCNLNKIAMD